MHRSLCCLILYFSLYCLYPFISLTVCECGCARTCIVIYLGCVVVSPLYFCGDCAFWLIFFWQIITAVFIVSLIYTCVCMSMIILHCGCFNVLALHFCPICVLRCFWFWGWILSIFLEGSLDSPSVSLFCFVFSNKHHLGAERPWIA